MCYDARACAGKVPYSIFASEIERRIDKAQGLYTVAVEEEAANEVDIVFVLQDGRQHGAPAQ